MFILRAHNIIRRNNNTPKDLENARLADYNRITLGGLLRKTDKGL